MARSDRLFEKQPLSTAADSSHQEQTRNSTTFLVSPVAPTTEPLPVVPYHEAVTEFLGGKVESCSQYHGQLVANVRLHPLIQALHWAFADHRPICLSPDMIWLTITQGLALHINENAEQLRHHFVKHEGKETIVVRRDDLVKGSPENPLPEVFNEFSSVIKEYIGETHRLIVADFSTTGPVERAASEIVLMDAMKAYFAYVVSSRCGIPSITLEGTVDDWLSINQRVNEFRRFGLDWWIDALEPLLNQFVSAASGRIDQSFWDSIYKWHGGEGSGSGPFVTGWVLNLFPYLNPVAYDAPEPGSAFCRNRWINRQPSKVDGPGMDRIPHLPAKAPFTWDYFDTPYAMEFIGGLMGVKQDTQTLCLRPEIGWAVWDVVAVEKKRQVDAEEAEKIRREEEEIAEREFQENAEILKRELKERSEISAKEAAVRSKEANRHFDQARKLGLHFHQLYLAAKPTEQSDTNLDEDEQNRFLLEIASTNYQANSDFRNLWNTVHGQPPAPLHAKWLSLWKHL